MDTKTRRAFFKSLAMGLVAIPFVRSTRAFAAACPAKEPAKAGLKIVKADDKQIKTLDFVFNAPDSKNPKYAKGQNCENCNFYNAKKLEEGWAPCSMFANKYVPGCGWCKSYKAKKA